MFTFCLLYIAAAPQAVPNCHGPAAAVTSDSITAAIPDSITAAIPDSINTAIPDSTAAVTHDAIDAQWLASSAEAAETICQNSSFSDAPPTRKPSTFGMRASSLQFSPLTEPP